MLSYKYRAYPKWEVEAKAVASIDAARYVYNWSLEQLNEGRKKGRNIRDDRNHQVSRRYVNANDLIFVEDLDILGMVSRQHKIAKLTVSARRTLRRNILDAAWGDFIRKLEYKAEGAGKRVVRIEAKNTTQKCSHCGNLVYKDITVRTHRCPYCGLEMDRDDNSAANVLLEGIKFIWAGNRPQPAEGYAYTALASNACGNGKRISSKQEATVLFR